MSSVNDNYIIGIEVISSPTYTSNRQINIGSSRKERNFIPLESLQMGLMAVSVGLEEREELYPPVLSSAIANVTITPSSTGVPIIACIEYLGNEVGSDEGSTGPYLTFTDGTPTDGASATVAYGDAYNNSEVGALEFSIFVAWTADPSGRTMDISVETSGGTLELENVDISAIAASGACANGEELEITIREADQDPLAGIYEWLVKAQDVIVTEWEVTEEQPPLVVTEWEVSEAQTQLLVTEWEVTVAQS